MQGVARLRHDKAQTGKPKVDRAHFARLRESASALLKTPQSPGLSDQFVIDAAPEEKLFWAADGVQASQMQRLKRGQLVFDGSLDLHGMTVERAREQLVDFLAEAQKLEVRCVRIVHGKASTADGRQPLLKSQVNSWLRQHPQVLGFASCLSRHGGTGAVYALLKSTSPKDEGGF